MLCVFVSLHFSFVLISVNLFTCVMALAVVYACIYLVLLV